MSLKSYTVNPELLEAGKSWGSLADPGRFRHLGRFCISYAGFLLTEPGFVWNMLECTWGRVLGLPHTPLKPAVQIFRKFQEYATPNLSPGGPLEETLEGLVEPCCDEDLAFLVGNCCNPTLTFWLAGDQGMEKKMEATIQGVIQGSIRVI